MALSLNLGLTLGFGQTNPLDLGTGVFQGSITKTLAFADGTGASQANKFFTDRRTITASGNDDLDLAGALVDAFGTTLTFTAIKGILVAAAAANANDLNVGGLGTNGFFTWLGATGDLVKIGPGDVMLATKRSAAGWAVTASTADLLRITNAAGGTSVEYEIALWGI